MVQINKKLYTPFFFFTFFDCHLSFEDKYCRLCLEHYLSTRFLSSLILPCTKNDANLMGKKQDKLFCSYFMNVAGTFFLLTEKIRKNLSIATNYIIEVPTTIIDFDLVSFICSVVFFSTFIFVSFICFLALLISNCQLAVFF